MLYKTTPDEISCMPKGIPHIIGNEAAERFSFYGMRTILVVFMTQYLFLLDKNITSPMNGAEATEKYHLFAAWVYFTPLLGAFLSDVFLGKYRTIMIFSIIYCIGHAALACMGNYGNSPYWLAAGLGFICLGAGGIKPCVSAHVGDQFGTKNQHLLSHVFHAFYFAINFGSFFSTLLTPWLLEKYGPHWAFGVPGVLMALATLVFWLGRNHFVHVPPSGWAFVRQIFSAEGIAALFKLIPLFLFIAMFWALYDQTSSSWVLQAEHMNLHFIKDTPWLASQVQAINPILILVFIPLFTLLVYPFLNRIIRLTALRKIGAGFFLTTLSFGIVAYTQSLIDKGQSPSILWQLSAFIVITAAEVLVSVVGLEFAYAQAPKNMKSVIMSLYLLSVFVGNIFTSYINHYIQIPSPVETQYHDVKNKVASSWLHDARNAVLPGHDGITGTPDDLVARLHHGTIKKIDFADDAQAAFSSAARVIEILTKNHNMVFPDPKIISRKQLGKDPFGNDIHYQIIDQDTCKLFSAGSDKIIGTQWDMGIMMKKSSTETITGWRQKIMAEKNLLLPPDDKVSLIQENFIGGGTKLQGTAYFLFFTKLMLATSLLFIPFAWIFREKKS